MAYLLYEEVISVRLYVISVFPREIESVFFKILLPNSKPISIGTTYRPTNQSNVLEVLNENMNKIDSISNEIYILGDFSINLHLNGHTGIPGLWTQVLDAGLWTLGL